MGLDAPLNAFDAERTLADESAPAAFVVDAKGEIVWTNPAAELLRAQGAFGEAARAVLERIGASTTTGLARIRTEGPGRAAMTFKGSRIVVGEGHGVLLKSVEPAAGGGAGAQAEQSAPSPDVGPALEELSTAQPDEPLRGEELPAPEPLAQERVAQEPVAEAPLAQEDAAQEDLAQEELAQEPAADEPVAEDDGGEADGGDEPAAAPAAAPDWSDLRFVFEIDAGGRIAFLSPDLGEVAGASAASALGRPWDEVCAELELDPAGEVAERLRTRAPWADVGIAWPLAGGGRLPLVLSALPIFDRGRTFIGFRGLGRATPATAPGSDEAVPVAQPDAAEASPTELASEQEPTAALTEAPETPPADRAAATSDAPSSAQPAPHLEEPEVAALSDEPPPIVSLPQPAETFEGNVVKLRDPAIAPRPPAPQGLSVVEETAFDEIARRLRDFSGRLSQEAPERPAPSLPETAEMVVPANPPADWTLDDVDGRAPDASYADDLLRVLDKLPLGALILRAGEVAHANRPALDMLGHSDLASLVSRGAGDLFAEQLPRDDAAPSNLRVLARDGMEIDVEARLNAISWRGAPATLVTLKRAEGYSAEVHSAIQREKEMAEILDTATDGVMTLDSAGRILSVNRSAQALFGIDARKVIGSLFTLSLAPESRRVAFDYLDSLKGSGVAAILNDGREVLGLASQGGAIPLYLTIGRIGPAHEGRYCAVLRDITHWKKAEEELLAAKRQAERANAQKSEFLTRVAHEIRTPLTAIIGFADVMIEERFGAVGNSRYRDYLRDIRQAGHHLIALVGDLLELSRVETGRLQLDFAPVDLNEALSQAAALLQPQANRDRVIIRTSLARTLPPVLADRKTLRQILTNLLSHAVKLSRPGGQVIAATVFTDAGQAVVRIRDSGAGMSPRDLAKAVEPFRPLTASKDSEPGGGLPLTKALAEANQALFSMQSEVGVGTVVEVTFPTARVLAD